MAQRDEQSSEHVQPRARWLQIAATLSGATALGLALLYASGLVARAGELVAAGFSPQDVLPLIPLQQGLARGVALFVDPAVAFIVAITILSYIIYFVPDWPAVLKWRDDAASDIASMLLHVRPALHALEEQGALSQQALVDLKASIDEAEIDARVGTDSHQKRARARLLRACHNVVEEAGQAAVVSEQVEELRGLLRGTKSPMRLPGGNRVVWVFLGVIGAWGILTARLAILPASVVVFGFLIYARWRAERRRPITLRAMRLALILAGATWVLGQAYLSPKPLQRVAMVRSDGSRVSGRLLASPGTQVGMWYVATDRGEIEAVSGDDATSVRLFRSGRDESRYDGISIWSAVFG